MFPVDSATWAVQNKESTRHTYKSYFEKNFFLFGSLVKESNRYVRQEKLEKNLWQVYTYETMDGLKGSFVYATTLSNPGELTT